MVEEAQAIETVIPTRELRHRRDYRDLPIVTIDGETARDFDDAVHVRRLENGNYELQVHIADVAQLCNSQTRHSTRKRVCAAPASIFPTVPFPCCRSNSRPTFAACVPQVDRLVLSCTMEIDHQGEVVGYEINEGVIRSAERMTYTAVNAVLEGDPSHAHTLRRRWSSTSSACATWR